MILGSSVLAHGIGGREDLPLPLGWAIVGAAAAVVVSFLALAVLWREPRLGTGGWARGRPLPRAVVTVLDAPAARRVVTALSLLVTAWVLLALVLGRDDARNPVPWVVYVLLWVGLVPVSVLLGPVWRVLNPLRALHAGLNRLLGLDPREGLRPLPSRLGYWPAALGLLAFTWLELVAPDNAELATLRTAVGLYAAVQLFCALLWGGRWFDRGDAFEVWSDLFGRLSPLGRRPDGTRVLRPPVVGLDLLPAAPGLAATVVVMLGSTAYDGLAGSTAWVGWVQAQALPRTLLGTAGLLGTVLLVGLLYAACAAAAGVVAGVGPRGMAAQFAPSVVPVALGYVVAHYYSLLVLEGQRAFVRLSDPLGTGADWLGTGSLTPSSALVTPTIVANVMVGSIVVGHVLGVMLAHDRAVRLFPRRRAVPGQLPLLVLMVSLTCLGLFLLFYD